MGMTTPLARIDALIQGLPDIAELRKRLHAAGFTILPTALVNEAQDCVDVFGETLDRENDKPSGDNCRDLAARLRDAVRHA